MSRNFQITVAQGGRLSTSLSQNLVGPADYVQKLNWRRSRDVEIRREGWLKFSPLPAISNQHVFDAALTCIKLIELVRPNGERALVGCSRSVIKKFNNTTGVWDTIGSGFSASGKRWQAATINGYLVLNNGVDLPVSWRVEDAAVTPIYEMREVGISAVGRISEYNGFLMVADITEIKADMLAHWMNGFSSYTVGSTSAKAASFVVASPADSTKEFDVTTGAADRTATLPATPSAGFYIWLKKVDAGVGRVLTSPLVPDIEVVLTAINDKALVWYDSAQLRWVAVYFSGGTIPATAPYGIPPSNITNRLPWAISNSEYGEPTMWAPAFDVIMASASASIVLPFASSVFVAGETRVAVVNGGPLGGTLGGQEDTPNGVLVTGVSGATITLEETTDATLTYPRTVTVLRWTDISSLSGRYELQGDNSEITSLTVLRDWLVISRTTGFYLGRYTGDPGAPFVFTPKYSGSNVPLWPDAIANVKGDYLLYPARGHRMYMFDAVTAPSVHGVTDDAATLFFAGATEVTEVFCQDNQINKEVWFFYPAQTICFDYDTKPDGTVSVIDQLFNAAAWCQKPGSQDVWFVFSIARLIYTNGLAYGVVPIATWLRDGVAAQSVLKFGLNSFGDQGNEKLLLNFTPIMGSASPDVDLEIQINSAWNPSATPVALLSPVESLPTPQGNNFVTLAFQALYIQDVITLVETADIDAQYSMRIWEVDLVNARGVTRSIN